MQYLLLLYNGLLEQTKSLDISILAKIHIFFTSNTVVILETYLIFSFGIQKDGLKLEWA